MELRIEELQRNIFKTSPQNVAEILPNSFAGSGAVVYLSYPGPTTVGLAYAEGWPPFGLALALYRVPTPLAE